MDKGEEGKYDGQGGEGDQNYYGNGNQQNYNGYSKEGTKEDENWGQVDQGTQIKKNKSRDDDSIPQKNSSKISPSNNPLISEENDIFDLDNPPLRNRSNTTYGFHSSFQAKRAAPPKLNKNNNQYQNNTFQNPISTPQSINNPLPKSSLAPSKSLNQSYTNNAPNLSQPYEIKPMNYKSNTIEKNITRNLYIPQSHSHAFIVNGLVYYTRCPNCNYALNVDPNSVQTSNQIPNIAPNNQRNNKYKNDSYKSKTIDSQSSLRALRTEPNSNQRDDRRLREQKEREDKKLRDKKEMEEKLKRQREERDRKFREERERKEREKKEQKEKQQREFQRLMEQKEKERNEKRDKDQQQRNLRSQGNQGYQGYQPNQRKEYKYTTQSKNSEYYQNKTITKNVIENPTVPKNYYINEKGVVVIVPPKSVKTSVTKIVTVNKPANSIYQSDGRSFGRSNNMGFYQSQAVETKVIVKPYRK